MPPSGGQNKSDIIWNSHQRKCMCMNENLSWMSIKVLGQAHFASVCVCVCVCVGVG